ncbi:MAG: hypothetical protein ACLP5H_31530 [Desulfomonilaceae bacterium]
MKPRRPSFRIGKVTLPPDGGGVVGGMAVFLQSIYSILGLLVGLVFLVVGVLLFLVGITGSSHFIADFLGGKIDVSDAPAGVILAVLGFLIIWVTRFIVKMQGNK